MQTVPVLQTHEARGMANTFVRTAYIEVLEALLPAVRGSELPKNEKICNSYLKCFSQGLAISQKSGIFLFFLKQKVSGKEKMCVDAAIPLDTSISLG